MAKARYYDKMGAPIEKTRWSELRQDPAYCEALSYSNGSVKLALVWVGKVADPELMSPEYWPLFRLDLFNLVDGVMRPAIETGDTFGSFEDGKRAYQDFLLRWTDCQMVDTGKGEQFEEVDNLYALPAEPDNDAPESVAPVGDDGVGVW